jgi:acyl-CoA reductase-like NAD-dependent aldehyde dehydrogenase
MEGKFMRYGMFINGMWVDSHSDRTEEIIHPGTGESIGVVPSGNEEDVKAAVDAAADAFGTWSSLASRERRSFLIRMAELIDEYGEILAELEAMDHGTPLKRALDFDVPLASNLFRYLADKCTDRMSGTLITENIIEVCLREPVGVAGIIIPWDAPLLNFALHTAVAIGMGNTAVVIPPWHAPLTALAMAKIFERANLPPGVINIVTGKDSGAILNQNSRVDLLIQGILYPRDRNEKKYDNSTMIILDDANISEAIKGAIYASFFNTGQSPCSVKRIYVQSSIFDEFMDNFVERSRTLVVGDPLDLETELGPIAREDIYESLKLQIASAIENGAKLVTGGKRPNKKNCQHGYFLEPTLLMITEDTALPKEDLMGPVVYCMEYEDIDSIEPAYRPSVSISIWTRDTRKGISLAPVLKAPVILINDHIPLFYPYIFKDDMKDMHPIGMIEEFIKRYSRTKHIYSDLSGLSDKPWYRFLHS